MKKSLVTIFLVTLAIEVNAQILTPVEWSYAAKKINKTEAILFLKANIENPWHIYSVNQKDGGPVKTTITFTPGKDYSLLGKISEPKPTVKFEKTFNMNVLYFSKAAIFQQKIKLNSSSQVTVRGTINFMVCNDEKCLPPDDVEFAIPIK